MNFVFPHNVVIINTCFLQKYSFWYKSWVSYHSKFVILLWDPLCVRWQKAWTKVLTYWPTFPSLGRQCWPWIERQSCYTQTEWGSEGQSVNVRFFLERDFFVPFSSVHSFIFVPRLVKELFAYAVVDSTQTDWFFVSPSPSLVIRRVCFRGRN